MVPKASWIAFWLWSAFNGYRRSNMVTTGTIARWVGASVRIILASVAESWIAWWLDLKHMTVVSHRAATDLARVSSVPGGASMRTWSYPLVLNCSRISRYALMPSARGVVGSPPFPSGTPTTSTRPLPPGISWRSTV